MKLIFKTHTDPACSFSMFQDASELDFIHYRLSGNNVMLRNAEPLRFQAPRTQIRTPLRISRRGLYTSRTRLRLLTHRDISLRYHPM